MRVITRVMMSMIGIIILRLLQSEPMESEPDSTHTCVIGAGYSGLAAARYLKQFGVNFTVFEGSRDFGGTWRFDPHVGLDEDGIPVTTSQYKYLRTNTPRQTMEYSGYPFPDGTPSFPTGTCFYKYLKSFVKHFDLLKHIQLRSLVTLVTRSDYYWNVMYYRTDTQEQNTVPCHFVVIANGQYVRPLKPNIVGLDTFQGKIIHSHDYKDPEAFRDRKVLLVGAGASGLDLAVQLHNITTKLVHSHHIKYNEPMFSKRYVKKPDIKVFVKNGAVFEDGSFEEVENVIFATGYYYDQPFLDDSSRLTRTGNFVLPLYQNIVSINFPSMMFIGVVDKVITKVLDVQAEYVASAIAGKFKLPTPEEMIKKWLLNIYNLQFVPNNTNYVNHIGNNMDNYFGNLTEEAGVDRVLPVLSEIRDFNAENRLEDLFNYRDYDFEVIDPYHYKRWYNGGGKRGEECPSAD